MAFPDWQERQPGARSTAAAPTDVCITIDAEFSVGGAFADPAGKRPVGDPAVLCRAEGRENGLGFLLACCARYGTKMTFFVEALNHHYFGDAPMGRHVERILAAGQDVQLHLHPCWHYFRHADWPDRIAREEPDDRCDGRGVDEFAALIEDGLATFRRWGVPEPTALRTGSLRADRNVYRAMAACGLPIASNLGLAYFSPEDDTLHLANGRHLIEGVLEVPVVSYTDLAVGSWRHSRLLTITASSWEETESLLWQARGMGLSPVVILTHPFEFAKIGDPQFREIARNRINQRRLERLCAFLVENCASFRAATFAEGGPRWLAAGPQPEEPLSVALPHAVDRIASNKLNDLIKWL
jgi:hypothetical protein